MNDMSSTIVAKSDQINAADLIGAPRTITIREVRIKAGEEQPVSILVEGDNKAFRPCKGVRRLLVRVWGPDANKYIGQSLTIFCDPTVTWAGKEEGGIRVSHMTGLDEKIVEFMRTSRAATKPYEIRPLVAAEKSAEPKRSPPTAAQWTDALIADVLAAQDFDALRTIQTDAAEMLGKLQARHGDLHARVLDAYQLRTQELRGPAVDDPAASNADPFDGGGTDE